jgi:hypothetical protein
MKTQFSIITDHGLSVIGCSEIEILSKFPGFEVTPMKIHPNDKLLEIRFDIGTLTCTFDENNACNMGLLFLDNLTDLDSYTKECQKQYEEITPSVWKNESNYIELRSHNFDFYFAFYSL